MDRAVADSLRGVLALDRRYLDGSKAWRWKRAWDDDEGGGSRRAPTAAYRVAGDGVAIVNLSGPLTKGWEWFGGTSTAWARGVLRAAVADAKVSSILLVLDSPGGTVAGVDDLAADVRLARESKPVVAFAEDECCSAAYWIASQAQAIYANPTAMVGSIGVFMAVPDISKALEAEGVKVHLVTTGPLKGAGTFGTEVTPDQLAAWQVEVDDTMALFEKAVRTGRSMPAKAFAEVSTGGVWIASKAKESGLVDGVRTLEATVAAMPKGRRPRAAVAEAAIRLAEST